MNPSGTGTSASSSLAGVSSASPSTGSDPSTSSCPKKKKHFVKVKLLFKDDKKPVPAAECKILKGTAVVEGGPLANGDLGTAKTLDAGSYEVTFPEIDANEWDVG